MNDRKNVIEMLGRRTDLPANFIKRYQHMIRWIKEPVGTSFIDIGCNTGIFDYHLACLGYEVHGIDFCERAIAVANNLKNTSTPVSGELRFQQGDATQLPFDDAIFDAGIACEVLEHIVNYKDAVAEICRVVKPGGPMYMSVPKERLAFDPAHVNFFTADDVESLVAEFGGKIDWHCHPKLDHLIFSFTNR